MTDFHEKKRVLSIYNSGSTTNPPVAIVIPFNGIYEDVINYESVSVIVNTTTAGNLTVKFLISPNDTNPQEVVFNHAGGQQLYETTMKARYMQIVYSGYDGATGTGVISTYLNPYATKETDLAAQYNLANPAEGHLDLFGRLRVSNLETLIDIKHIRGLGLNTLNVASLITGGSGATQTLDTNAPVVHMSVSDLGDRVVRQSRVYLQYQPGKSMLIYMTGRIITNATSTGVITKMGYYDDSDGVFFSWNEGVMSVGVRTSTSGVVVDTYIPYTAWNNDRLDGSGVSGISVDWTTALIYTINLAWLGVGIIKFGVIWGGNYYHAHTIYNIGGTTTYTATSNLPIRYSIQSTGGAGQLDMICMSASSEAGYSLRGSPFSISTATKTVTSTETYLLALRLKQDYRSVITLNNANILCNSGGNLEITIYRYIETNPITGGTWNDAGSLTSMQYNTTGTWVLGTPIQLFRTYISSNDFVARVDLSQLDKIFMAAGVANGGGFASDVLVITARKITAAGTARDVEMSLGWTETI
jgi:hypothetical protein